MCLLYVTNRFHLFVVCPVKDAQRMTQRGKNICDKNICDPLDFASWATFLFLPRCDVICASITEQTMANGIYLLNSFG